MHTHNDTPSDPDAGPPVGAGAERSAQDALARSRGIHAIRHSLAFGEREEALVRGARGLLTPEIDGWVDGFYARLMGDPSAMALLEDDARVIRLKRSLTAWFHELFAMPFDEQYERARESIGHRHVEIDMPQFLMVSAIASVRRDVAASIQRLVADDPARCRALDDAMSKLLDMELALMLAAYRRHERALARLQGRNVFAERATRRFTHLVRDRVDAALCHLELARRAEGEEREGALARLRDVIRRLGHVGVRREEADVRTVSRSLRIALLDLCTGAAANVSLAFQARVEIEVVPRDLHARLHADVVRRALEELLENALTHGGAQRVRIHAQAVPDHRAVEILVQDDGSGWSAPGEGLGDAYAGGIGLGLSFCEFVAEAHHGHAQRRPSSLGGAAVLLWLREPDEAQEEAHAHQHADS